jgi:hypothetical protein
MLGEKVNIVFVKPNHFCRQEKHRMEIDESVCKKSPTVGALWQTKKHPQQKTSPPHAS